MNFKNAVLASHPNALCLHVPMSMAVAIYSGGKMIGNAAIDAYGAWQSAARILSEQPEPRREQ